MLVTGRALRQEGLELAGKIAAKTGARLMAQGSNARTQRGRGRVFLERVPYVVDQATKVLAGLKHVILVGAKMPVAFFAYPDKPSLLAPSDAQGHVLARLDEDMVAALEALAEEVGARGTPAPVVNDPAPVKATGRITPEALGASLGALLPENAVVVDEAVTTGRGFFAPTRSAAPHDWLSNMGGSIGLGMPLATGAAIACPDRKVVTLEGDGSAMYTVQALWTQAREGLDVTTLAVLEPQLSDFKGGARQCRRRQSRPQGARHARPRQSRPRFRHPGEGHGCSRRARRRHGGVQPPARRGDRHPRPLPRRGGVLNAAWVIGPSVAAITIILAPAVTIILAR